MGTDPIFLTVAEQNIRLWMAGIPGDGRMRCPELDLACSMREAITDSWKLGK
jgi:hypothetical protein